MYSPELRLREDNENCHGVEEKNRMQSARARKSDQASEIKILESQTHKNSSFTKIKYFLPKIIKSKSDIRVVSEMIVSCR